MALLIATCIARPDPAARRRAAIGLVSLVVAVAWFQLWRRGLERDDPPHGGINATASTVVRGVRLYFTAALFLSPVVWLRARPRAWGWPPWSCGFAVGAIGIGVLLRFGHTLTIGNYLDHRGAYDSAFAGSRTVLPMTSWHALTALALASGAVLAATVVSRWREWRSVPVLPSLFVVLTMVGTAAQMAAGQGVFDRYLLPLLPAAALLLLLTGRTGRVQALAGGASLMVLGVVSLSLTASGLAFDAARWDAASSLAARGVPTMAIDAGLEWLGHHSEDGAYQDAVGGSGPHETSYSRMFPDAVPCRLVAASTIDGLALESEHGYRRFAVWGSAQLYVHEISDC
jgi:hypothetical protein